MEASVLFLLLTLSLTDVLCVVLKEGDEGVCKEAVDELVTRQKTYRCSKGRRRTCTRIEHLTVSKEDLICCDGWYFHEDKCVPKVISCDPPCHNAQCTSTNNCTCNSGLAPLNHTHCGPLCSLGFYNDPADPALSCKSQCSESCIFSNCTDFDTCSCIPGYEPHSQFQCKPICKTCEFGTCTAPNVCTCLPGYNDNGDGKCRPVCQKCEHGKCVGPDDCACDEGYTKKDDECQPVCDLDCEKGHCSAPNECTCATDHILDPENKFRCNPICEQKCVNSTCVSPHTCRCNDGYESAENDWTCQPKCDSCENGECIAPNVCICSPGYARNLTGFCQPICNKPCINAKCVEPEKCECLPGYQINGDSEICKPVCEDVCVNAYCISPNQCECESGYEKGNTSNICKPACESCSGECVAPNQCRCYEWSNDTCIPTPVLSCKLCEGTCIEGACVCSNGTVCQEIDVEAAEVASTPTLAGLQLTWMLGGAIGVLLIVIVVVVMQRMWRKRHTYDQKTQSVDMNAYGSVVYTVPDTLMQKDYPEQDYDEVEPSKMELLPPGVEPEDYVERI